MESYRDHEQGRYRPIHIEARPPQPDDNWPYHNHPTTPHDREYGIKNPKFERHIFIRRDQVFYDIDAQLGMLATARRKDDGTEDNNISQATTSYQSMFYRWIDTYIGRAKTIMSAVVLEKFQQNVLNSIKDTEEVDIELLVPESGFQQLNKLQSLLIQHLYYPLVNLQYASFLHFAMNVGK